MHKHAQIVTVQHIYTHVQCVFVYVCMHLADLYASENNWFVFLSSATLNFLCPALYTM